MTKKRKIISRIGIVCCFLIFPFLAFAFYIEHVKSSIQIVDIPEILYEVLPENPRELKGSIVPIKRYDREGNI